MRPVQSGTQNSILLAVLSNYFHSFRSPAFFISEIITFSHLFQSIAVSAKVIHQIVYMPTLVRFEMLSCLIAQCLIFNTAAYLLRLRVLYMYLFVITGLQSSSNPPPPLTYIWVKCPYPEHMLAFCVGFATLCTFHSLVFVQVRVERTVQYVVIQRTINRNLWRGYTVKEWETLRWSV